MHVYVHYILDSRRVNKLEVYCLILWNATPDWKNFDFVRVGQDVAMNLNMPANSKRTQNHDADIFTLGNQTSVPHVFLTQQIGMP
jgi:hypothetical protein